jgi:hypothetical protein
MAMGDGNAAVWLSLTASLILSAVNTACGHLARLLDRTDDVHRELSHIQSDISSIRSDVNSIQSDISEALTEGT